MKETYLSRDFRETATQRFASQVKELNAFFDMRLNALLAENFPLFVQELLRCARRDLPVCNSFLIIFGYKKSTVILSELRWTYGGEGGIRTLDTLMGYTRFPIVRARPGYATSP